VKYGFSFFCIFFFAVSWTFSIQLEDLIPFYAERLNSGNDLITETQLRNPVPRLLPENSEIQQHVTRAMDTLNPNVLVETLYLYRKPANLQTGPLDDNRKIGLFNQFLALSTLTGIQYFSASRQAMRIFFEYSTVIDGLDTKNPLPDPVYSRLPAELILYARQKDLTFGDNIYRYNYFTSRDAIFFIQENITSLSFALVPVIGRGNLRSVMAVFDCGDSLLVYAVSMARAFSVPGMGERVGTSFSNRAEAVLKWFTGRADLVFGVH
jgi:hypothetical protein